MEKGLNNDSNIANELHAQTVVKFQGLVPDYINATKMILPRDSPRRLCLVQCFHPHINHLIETRLTGLLLYDMSKALPIRKMPEILHSRFHKMDMDTCTVFGPGKRCSTSEQIPHLASSSWTRYLRKTVWKRHDYCMSLWYTVARGLFCHLHTNMTYAHRILYLKIEAFHRGLPPPLESL